MKTIAILLLFGVEIAPAQFAISWFTIDGGGGQSRGGAYSVAGTVGQADAGLLGGGPYLLAGGFWGGVLIQTPEAPALHVALRAGDAIVFWDKSVTGFVLEETAALASMPSATVWSQVPFPYQTNATDIFVTVPAPRGNRFYRLSKP